MSKLFAGSRRISWPFTRRLKWYLGMAVVIAGVFLVMVVQASMTTLTGLAYSDDPASGHYQQFRDNPVIYTANADGQTFVFSIVPCGNASGAVNDDRLMMGGFRRCFETAAAGTQFTVSASRIRGTASCTLEIVGPYRYCGVYPHPVVPLPQGEGLFTPSP